MLLNIRKVIHDYKQSAPEETKRVGAMSDLRRIALQLMYKNAAEQAVSAPGRWPNSYNFCVTLRAARSVSELFQVCLTR
jgi:hypothetical protein